MHETSRSSNFMLHTAAVPVEKVQPAHYFAVHTDLHGSGAGLLIAWLVRPESLQSLGEPYLYAAWCCKTGSGCW